MSDIPQESISSQSTQSSESEELPAYYQLIDLVSWTPYQIEYELSLRHSQGYKLMGQQTPSYLLMFNPDPPMKMSDISAASA